MANVTYSMAGWVLSGRGRGNSRDADGRDVNRNRTLARSDSMCVSTSVLWSWLTRLDSAHRLHASRVTITAPLRA
jgi:hypothetical protein